MAMVVPSRPQPLEEASEFALHSGGAESNVAMYLAGLGHRAGWVSRLGDDPLGRRVLRDVAAAGVDTSLVELDQTAPTGVYFKDPQPSGTKVFYYRRGSAASYMRAESLRPLLARPPRVVHVSGITPALSSSCAEMIEEVFRLLGGGASGVLISFDVNYRPALWPAASAAPTLARLARKAGVVFVGLDEAEVLWGARTAGELRGMLSGPRTLVVKDGSLGATEFDGPQETFVASLPVQVSEPVGAGDAFAAGWLSGWLRELPSVQRLRLGHLLAAAALSSTADHQAPPPPQLVSVALSLDEKAWAAGPSTWDFTARGPTT